MPPLGGLLVPALPLSVRAPEWRGKKRPGRAVAEAFLAAELDAETPDRTD